MCVLGSDDDGMIARKATYDLLDGCRDITNAGGVLKCAGMTRGVKVMQTPEGNVLDRGDAANADATLYLFILVGLAAACVLFLILSRSTSSSPLDTLSEATDQFQAGVLNAAQTSVAGAVGFGKGAVEAAQNAAQKMTLMPSAEAAPAGASTAVSNTDRVEML
jgi:hypothetical protein